MRNYCWALSFMSCCLAESGMLLNALTICNELCHHILVQCFCYYCELMSYGSLECFRILLCCLLDGIEQFMRRVLLS